MEPHKTEIEALREVMFTPVESFVTEKERAEKGEEWAEKTAHRRMFAAGIKAVEEARGARTLYTVAIGFGPSHVRMFGLYPTEATAEKARAKMLAALGNLVKGSAVRPWQNEHAWAAMLARADVPAPARGDWAAVAEDARLTKLGWDGKRATRKKYEEMS